MMGGWSNAEVTPELRGAIDNHVTQLNGLLNQTATSYTINSVQSQVVNGTNYFYHLTDNHGDKHSAYAYAPFGQPPTVQWAENGHTGARHVK